jgi:hypothetical protein
VLSENGSNGILWDVGLVLTHRMTSCYNLEESNMNLHRHEYFRSQEDHGGVHYSVSGHGLPELSG